MKTAEETKAQIKEEIASHEAELESKEAELSALMEESNKLNDLIHATTIRLKEIQALAHGGATPLMGEVSALKADIESFKRILKTI